MDKEYIEREATLKKLSKNSITKKITLADGVCIFDAIKNIPAADVVEVVRCKDCKDYRQNPYRPEEDMICMCWCDWLPTDPDDFCSYGVRKEGAEE